MSIDLSLTRLQHLLPSLPYTRPTLHIAGTNGKGSTTSLLSSILLASAPPLRVGRFNSPHLVSVLDCITLNDAPVSLEAYKHARGEVEEADRERGTGLTSFEVLTMTALRIFENARVDIVVLEVGLGGRLDATNVVGDECIVVSALAAVDLDHQAFLGGTVGLIAREKAGIARRGKPFVLGRQGHGEVLGVVSDVVGGVGGVLSPALEVQLEEKGTDPVHALLPLHGAHQLDNLGTALGVIDALLSRAEQEPGLVSLDLKKRITLETIARGIQNAKWPGRLSFHTISVPITAPSSTTEPNPVPESVDLLVLADGAHNPASAATLGAYIQSILRPPSSSSRSPSSSSASPSSHSSSTPAPQQTSQPDAVHITYILSLSHSPPKTPLQTLGPILVPLPVPAAAAAVAAPTPALASVSVALLRFTPPEGMPWAKPVPPLELEGVVRGLMPEVEAGDLWVESEPKPRPEAERQKEGGKEGRKEEGRNRALEDALRWAAGRQVEFERLLGDGETGGGSRRGRRGRGLVVLAGSLYLVADFYRLLEGGF
ncbi:hypothetical protein GALMADRAFT_80109 [Galerina marginata CBS 339.88]|uniref:Mur ligase central domain-containing protein n=1 Tax=Galerina marginata (strain CBS 339.88) TaxID=685588 RepID=A0A067SH91_GALM3|nr:hypothetical protein GALMADRAFT_80109 [Galerina marginata CBS 339.88]